MKRMVAVFLICSLGAVARGESDKELSNAIDNLTGPSRGEAYEKLKAMDSKVVVAALIERLKKNVDAGKGMDAASYHAAPMFDKDGNQLPTPWLIMEPHNLAIASQLADRQATEAADLVETALRAMMEKKPRGDYTVRMAQCVYLLSGKFSKCWNADKKTEVDYEPTPSDKECWEKIAPKNSK